jgi:GNAT superfamily N-acetyltransferase
MLRWAKARAAEMAAQGEGRPMWFVSIDANCTRERHQLETQGFEDISDVGEDSWSKVLFELTDTNALKSVQLPAGLALRSLNPNAEIQKYVDLHRAVFESESMTYDWRANATRMADYTNALDLVIATEDGDLCAFCVGWVRQQASGEIVGQIEPLGVRKSHRGKKLSRLMMTEAIRRMRELGATRIFVETDKQRTEAMAAYESMGFHVSHEVLVYKHTVAHIA